MLLLFIGLFTPQNATIAQAEALGTFPTAIEASARQEGTTPAAVEASTATGKKDPLPKPDPNAFCNSPSTCISSVVYIFTVGLGSMLAYVGSAVFNLAVQITLNSAAYSQQFLTSGWAAARDIANMLFIFILIYTAYIIVVKAETVGTMKTLAAVIVMALLINFSFFFTRVIIDAGNILAVQFYNAIQVPSISTTQTESQTANPVLQGLNRLTPGDPKDLTHHIMGIVQVQNILNVDSFKQFTKDNNFLTNVIVQSVIYICVGAIFVILAFAFIMVGFKFVIRVIILWFVIIAAPLAFAMRALSNNKIAQRAYDEWQSALLMFSFYPAVFLFMFLIMNYIMQQMGGGVGLVPGIFANLTNGPDGTAVNSLGSAIANVLIRMGFVVIMLFYGLSLADKMVLKGSGFASQFTGWAGNKMSRGFGSMTFGTAGWAARSTVGRASSNYAKSDEAKKFASKNILSRLLVSKIDKLGSANFDARSTRLKPLATKLGVDIGDPTKVGGGYAKRYADRVAYQKGQVEKYRPSAAGIEASEKVAFDDYYKNLTAEKKLALMNARSEYNKALSENEGVESAATKKALKDATKNLNGEMQPFQEIAKKIGTKYAEDFAGSIKPGFFSGLASSRIPFVTSAADKSVVKELENPASKKKDRLSELLKDVPEPPKTTPAPSPLDGFKTATTVSPEAQAKETAKFLGKINNQGNRQSAGGGGSAGTPKTEARSYQNLPELNIMGTALGKRSRIQADGSQRGGFASSWGKVGSNQERPRTEGTAVMTPRAANSMPMRTVQPWSVPHTESHDTQTHELRGIRRSLERVEDRLAEIPEALAHEPAALPAAKSSLKDKLPLNTEPTINITNKTTVGPTTLNVTSAPVSSVEILQQRLTPDAAKLLSSVDAEGVPAIATSNLKRILRENGVPEDDITQKTPAELITQLRGLQS